jgi:hypothetical protein
MEDIHRTDDENARKLGKVSGGLQRHRAFLYFFSASHRKHIT